MKAKLPRRLGVVDPIRLVDKGKLALGQIDFTRATSATYLDANGTLQTASSGNYRQTPTGIFIEGARTNSITNSTMAGGSSGTPGVRPNNWGENLQGLSLTRTYSTVSGMAVVDYRFFGTATAGQVYITLDSISQIAASSGQTWSNSARVALIAGSFSNVTSARWAANTFTSGGAFVANAINVDISAATSTLTWYNGSATLSGGTTAFIQPLFTFQCNAAAIDFTIRIAVPQLELGSGASSFIATSSGAATRNADASSVSNLQQKPWFNPYEGTIVFEFQTPLDVTGFNRVFWIGENSATLEGLYTGAQFSVIQLIMSDHSGTAQAILTPGTTTWTKNTKFRCAFRYKENLYGGSVNGSPVAVDQLGTTLTSATDRFTIGASGNGNNSLFGTIYDLHYYDRALDDGALVNLSKYNR